MYLLTVEVANLRLRNLGTESSAWFIAQAHTLTPHLEGNCIRWLQMHLLQAKPVGVSVGRFG